jgi:hypothetical protein
VDIGLEPPPTLLPAQLTHLSSFPARNIVAAVNLVNKPAGPESGAGGVGGSSPSERTSVLAGQTPYKRPKGRSLLRLGTGLNSSPCRTSWTRPRPRSASARPPSTRFRRTSTARSSIPRAGPRPGERDLPDRRPMAVRQLQLRQLVAEADIARRPLGASY